LFFLVKHDLSKCLSKQNQYDIIWLNHCDLIMFMLLSSQTTFTTKNNGVRDCKTSQEPLTCMA